ncbi:D-alanyl-D-alanine carboxypeptidase family protein [Cellulosilyticum ruminicola]|uniref:D-alanyl-D-alanine carboxypeptidase family protein n=1 Tax=Cellulosilyticum ruminicola TaxID=425254 RepID=UPI0006CFB5C1|nr:S-layer homology domain-containing protein [Cellulosilyticum ruminicola]
MYRKFIYFLLGLSFICNSLWATPLPELSSDGAVLIEPTTKTVLFAKNANETFYPASTTKILTSLLLVEDLDKNLLITKTADSLANVPSDSSQIGLNVGSSYSAYDGVHAIMMASDNFVAYDMAVKDAGSISAFAQKMNEKACALGATASHFINPHGYHDEDHYTTPYDLGLIARGAFANQTLTKIASTLNYTFTDQSNGNRIPLTHTSALLNPNSNYYNSAVTSCKTGYHTPAKRTLVTKAHYDNIDLIAVTMRTDAPNQFIDMNKLLDYGAKNFSLIQTDTGELQIKNTSYSEWAEPYVNAALERGWINNSVQNYMAPISQREFLLILQKALPEKYQETVAGQILYSGRSIYNESQHLSRKNAAKLNYDFLQSLGFSTDYLPVIPNVTDLTEVKAAYDDAIHFMVQSGLMMVDDAQNFYPNSPLTLQQGIYTAYRFSELLNRYDSYSYTPK